MSRVEEIEAQIQELSAIEYRQLVSWIEEREQSEWARQIDDDSATGKLDFLFAEASTEPLRPWPDPAE